MKKIFVVLVIVLNLKAQNLFQVQVDAAKFYGNNETSFVEFYYSFDVSKLSLLKVNNKFTSDAIIRLICKKSSNDSIIVDEEWKIPFEMGDSLLKNQSRIYTDIFPIYLNDDVFRIKIKITDFNNSKTADSIDFLFNSELIQNDKISSSDLELCSSISQSENKTNNPFYKNTFDVRPNPSRIFGTHLPVLYYYLELYNLNNFAEKQFKIKTSILNSMNKEVVSSEKIKKNSFNSLVDVGMMKVNSLNTGAYILVYQVLDSNLNIVIANQKKFFIYNSTKPIEDTNKNISSNILLSEYSTFTESEIFREFEISKYIATKSEIDQFKKMNSLDGKINYLVEFWNKKNYENKNNSKNYKTEYFKRVEKVNQLYKTGFKEGWKTDRGRVYIVYGEPDEIERHNNEIDTKPYEIWFYNSMQGGVRFYFGDRTGFSDYQLLHSTHRDELHDEKWSKYLQAQ